MEKTRIGLNAGKVWRILNEKGELSMFDLCREFKYKLIFRYQKKMLNIVIFGAPGSGKGTQSERIVEKYGINHISTGDVLRAEIKNGTELGKTAKSYIDQGQLIPDELMIDILASVFDSFEDSKGVIFDGFPEQLHKLKH